MKRSLAISDLKRLLHGEYARIDKLLIVLASFDHPCQVKDVKLRAREAGFREPGHWNVSAYLVASKGKAIRTPEGWEISEAGRGHLAAVGVSFDRAGHASVATDLRRQLSGIPDPDTRSYVEEAVSCYEAGFYRSAIIMSWVGAVAVMYGNVHTHHLRAFNREATRRNQRWRSAKTTDDLSRMKESVFLDIIGSLSIIGRNVKTQLKACLDRRNACGHPSSLQIRANTAAHHLEVLLLNVFQRF